MEEISIREYLHYDMDQDAEVLWKQFDQIYARLRSTQQQLSSSANS